MKNTTLAALIFNAVVLCSTTFSAKGDDIALSGFLVDRTISRFGRDFYQGFSQTWRDIPVSMTEGVNLVIKETVVPRSGTRLVIERDNKPIYMTHFGRRNTIVKRQVEQALHTVVNDIARINFNASNSDMAADGY